LRRSLGVLAAIILLAAGLSVPAAQAKQHMLVGLQDDAMVLFGNPTFTFRTLKQLRVQIVRINLNWDKVAKRRPAHPQDPADPAYDWTVYDRAIRYAGQNGMQVLLTILFVPSWANGGQPHNVPPTNYNDLRNFSYAAATRYSGHYIPNTDSFDEVYLPAVKYWLAWNEPSNPNWLQQVSGGRFVSPRSYARICTAIWQGVHFTNFAGEQVACGATARRSRAARPVRAETTRRGRAAPRCRRSPSCVRPSVRGCVTWMPSHTTRTTASRARRRRRNRAAPRSSWGTSTR
jgi:hypothetical protein